MNTPQQTTKNRADMATAYREHHKGLTSHAYFKVHNHTTTVDLVQDTFIKTWLYLVRGGKVLAMKAFLFHVLNCLIIDEYRKRKAVSLDALIEDGFDVGVEEQTRYAQQIDGKSAVKYIDKLPAKYAAVMRLKFVKDLSLQEMSTITGLSKNTVAVQIHRGIKKLRALYDASKTLK